jgi:hypothetical protein
MLRSARCESRVRLGTERQRSSGCPGHLVADELFVRAEVEPTVEDDRVRPRIAAVRLGEAEAGVFGELRLTGVEQQHPAVFAKRVDAGIGDERRTLRGIGQGVEHLAGCGIVVIRGSPNGRRRGLDLGDAVLSNAVSG